MMQEVWPLDSEVVLTYQGAYFVEGPLTPREPEVSP